MGEAENVKEQLDALRDKIEFNHNTSPDKSFLKAKLNVYEKFLPTLDLEGLKKQLDTDETICKTAIENAKASV